MSDNYREWHQPRNEACPHNEDPEKACNCERPKKVRKRKPYRRVRVNDRSAEHGFRSRIELRIYPDGVLHLREVGRRRLYKTTVFSIYKTRVMAEAFAAVQAKRANKAQRRKERKQKRKGGKR